MSLEQIPSSANAGLVRANSVLPPVVLVPPAPELELLELVPPAPVVVALPVVALLVVALLVVALPVVALPVVALLLVLLLVLAVVEAVVATVLVTVVEPTVVCVAVVDAVPVVEPMVALASSLEPESLELHAAAATNTNERNEAGARKLLRR